MRYCIAAATAFLWSFPVLADTQTFSHSTVELRDTDAPGAAAEIEFFNSSQDGYLVGTLEMTHGDVVCTVSIKVGFPDPDWIEPECPGYVAVPHRLEIVDASRAVVLLYPVEGVGM